MLLPLGWVQGAVAEFKYFDQFRIKSFAGKVCSNESATLASITTQEELSLVTRYIYDYTANRVAWLGGIVRQIDEAIVWDDGLPHDPSVAPWDIGEPNLSLGNHIRINVQTQLKSSWLTRSTRRRSHFVCKRYPVIEQNGLWAYWCFLLCVNFHL